MSVSGERLVDRCCGTGCGFVWWERFEIGLVLADRVGVEERSRLTGTGRGSFVVVVLGFGAGAAVRQGEIEVEGARKRGRAARVDRAGDPGRTSLWKALDASAFRLAWSSVRKER